MEDLGIDWKCSGYTKGWSHTVMQSKRKWWSSVYFDAAQSGGRKRLNILFYRRRHVAATLHHPSSASLGPERPGLDFSPATPPRCYSSAFFTCKPLNPSLLTQRLPWAFLLVLTGCTPATQQWRTHGATEAALLQSVQGAVNYGLKGLCIHQHGRKEEEFSF